jgi:hypothetical protein
MIVRVVGIPPAQIGARWAHERAHSLAHPGATPSPSSARKCVRAAFCGKAIRRLGRAQTPSSRAAVGVHPRRRRGRSGFPLYGLDSAPSGVQIGRHWDAKRACFAAPFD